ncbi:MAG: hypothetical protein A2W33_06595 [Chloroflexi bacterium RBG_16_52_11]|nr:MAG: hypothetical protein A2W33_06595 [Chloroflexi bacterium RBG_16_52_11]
MSRGNIFWGIVLLLGGVLLLLDNLGYFGNIEVWTLIWPLFLIALGVWLLIGAALRRNIKSEHVVIPLEGAQSARLRFQHGAGRIILSSSASSANLMEGDFGGGLDVSKRQSGSLLEVKMKMSGSIFPFDWSPGQSLDWVFGLNQDIPLTLELETGASDNTLDLTALQVSEITLKSGASSTKLTLPANAGRTRVSIEAGAASVKITVPEGVAARIRSKGGLSSINVNQQRFIKSGDLYQSVDYDTARNQADIDVQMGVGSVEVR